MRNTYAINYPGDEESKSVFALSRPFQGGFEDFLPITLPVASDRSKTTLGKGGTLSSFDPSNDPAGSERHSLLEDLVFYWQNSLPPGFDTNSPTLLSLSYYAMKIIAAEWTLYMTVIYHSIKPHEYNPSANPALSSQIETLNANLSSLQKWARRSMSFSQKIRHILDLLRSQGQPTECSTSLIEDWEGIGQGIDIYSHQLEARVPIVTSLIQIIDSQRSFAETANITRLTYLALVFVPLTFVSSLSSMNDRFAPGGRIFWLYFVTAVPLCLAVFVVARPSARAYALLSTWKWKRRKSIVNKIG